MDVTLAEMKHGAEAIERYLFKYYNDDETRDPEIPDILDALYEQHDALEKELASYFSLSYISNKNIATELITRIEEERSEFYIVEKNRDGYIQTAYPVTFREHAVRTPYLAGDRVKWTNTGERVVVPGFEVPYASSKTTRYFLLPTDNDEYHYYYYSSPLTSFPFLENLVPGDKYVGFEAFEAYLQFRESIGDTIMFRECVVCKELFNVSSGELDWLRYKKFVLPKRCPKHREHAFSHSDKTSLFS